MKKAIISLCLCLIALTALPAQPVLAARKSAAVHTTMKWNAAALKKVSNLRSFDYSTAIRDTYVRKIEKYAKRKKIKVITPAVIDGMRE